jgi:carbonic anhydrase
LHVRQDDPDDARGRGLRVLTPVSELDQILAANERYAATFGFGDLEPPPGRRFAVVTCMDARLIPARLAGLDEGDAHVIRNAGAVVTDDVLRSLTLSCWFLGTREAIVVGHTDCGMVKVTNELVREKLAENGADAGLMDFLPYTDVEENVRSGVRRIRESDLLPDWYGTAGLVYDVRCGRLTQVT